MQKPILSAISFVLIAYALSFGSLTGWGRNAPLLAAEASPAQSPAPPSQHNQASQPNMPDMMKMHQQMMAELTTAEAKLDQLVKEMNSARGDAKISAIAQVVNELARQQKAMHERMGAMHQQMMMSGQGMMRK